MKYLILLILLSACMGKEVKNPQQPIEPAVRSENLSYLGKYDNRCEDCPQGLLTLQISENFTYLIGGQMSASGTYKWSADGKMLLLMREGLPELRLGVIPNALVFESTGDTLYKLPENGHQAAEAVATIPPTRWTLTELRGKATRKVQKEDPFMNVAANRTFTAYAGCNSIGGKFTVNGSQIKFDDVIRTEMACEGAALETPFIQALSEADNFIVNGKRLQLRRGQSVIAKFEALAQPEEVR